MLDRHSSTLLGGDEKSLKIHDLVKAPANTPWAKERQQSWDASKPATVYHTPEMTADGEPCTAVTVILRTKGCHWWWPGPLIIICGGYWMRLKASFALWVFTARLFILIKSPIPSWCGSLVNQVHQRHGILTSNRNCRPLGRWPTT